ncbi:MAG: PHP domain-containing protein [Bacillota bacterium]|nr:PHP domain-containing protein [Bacillota bacterium]
MFIDLHMHEMTCSGDSFLSLDEIVSLARKRGLDAVCITDHDNMGLKRTAAEYTLRTGFPIFVGIEYYSLQGDILAFGIDHYPEKRVNAQEFVDSVRLQRGATISAHPFRSNQRGLAENLSLVRGLDAIEVCNGSTDPDATALAAEYARRMRLGGTGGSDCHVPERVGVCATFFPGKISTVEELAAALRRRECMPAYHKNGRYHIWDIQKQAASV